MAIGPVRAEIIPILIVLVLVSTPGPVLRSAGTVIGYDIIEAPDAAAVVVVAALVVSIVIAGIVVAAAVVVAAPAVVAAAAAVVVVIAAVVVVAAPAVVAAAVVAAVVAVSPQALNTSPNVSSSTGIKARKFLNLYISEHPP
jgi:Meckel syndrome type 1 protein